MSANVETAVYANTPAWHREGIVLDSNGEKGLSIEEALPASGLDWEVVKVPIFAYSAYDKDGKPTASARRIPINGRFGVQRKSDKKVFGTVGGTWQPVQNIEGFQLVDDVIAQAGGKAWIESAMALDGGKKVVVMVHLDTDLQIAGEKYNSYLTFVNGHDGRTSVTAMTNDMRVVCANTLEFATNEANKSGRVVRVRHTTKATERIKEAAAILGLRNQRLEELAQQGEWLVEQEMGDGDFDKFLSELMPIDASETPAATMAQQRRDEVASVYNGAANLKPIRGTRWGALQAVLEYSDHRREFKSTDTAIKAQLGVSANPLKDRAFQIVRNPNLELVG